MVAILFSPFERMVAMRYLRARRQEGFISVITWLSFLGIAIGVAALIVVMSVMSGFRQDLFSRVIGLNGHMNIYATNGSLYDYQALLDRVKQVPDVIDIAPTIEGQALITQNGVASGAYVRGTARTGLEHRTAIAGHIIQGSLADFGDDRIAIGTRMADRLHVNVGDTITLISPVSKTTVFGAAPRLRGYKIAAIFDVGMYEYDNNFIFMPLEAAQAFFSMGQGVSALEIFVHDPYNLSDARNNIVAAIGGPGYRLLDWRQNNGSFYAAIEVERIMMAIILTLIILVAALNIISALIMLVKDKGRGIAILRTMGATRGMVMRIFFLNGATIGTVGTALGVVLGVFITHHLEGIRQVIRYLTRTDPFSPQVYFLSKFPSVVDWSEVTWIVILSLSLSFLATLYPSWRAARLDPVEALRYE
jgi:lipoprotein-releasing system permease protein